MKISVSRKNEFKLVPDIADNLEKPEDEQFKIFFKKLSSFTSNEWTNINTKTQEATVDFRKRLELSLLRFENAPILSIDDGENEIELTIEILLSGEYPELFDLESIIINEMTRIDQETQLDKKKF